MDLSFYLESFFRQPLNIALVFLLWGLSAASIFAARKAGSAKWKLALIMAHVLLLVSPTALFAYRVGCEIPVYQCGEKTLVYAIPVVLFSAVAVTAAVLFFLMPGLFLRHGGIRRVRDAPFERMVKQKAAAFGLSKVRAVLLDTGRPLAFSLSAFNPAIFISVGMAELLSRDELEAVVLHELGHIRNRSSLGRISAVLGSFFSPLGRLEVWNTGKDEERADRFAASAQGTYRHLLSAKKKLEQYGSAWDSQKFK